jgi:hypothetical protein
MDQLVSTILDYSVQLLATVAFAVFVVAVRSGLSYLSTKIGGEKVNMAAKLALTVVRALEQQGELLGFDGARKKEMAIVMLRQLFAKFSIDISEDLLDHLIEAAVQTINTEAGKFGPIVEIGEATVGG